MQIKRQPPSLVAEMKGGCAIIKAVKLRIRVLLIYSNYFVQKYSYIQQPLLPIHPNLLAYLEQGVNNLSFFRLFGVYSLFCSLGRRVFAPWAILYADRVYYSLSK